MNPQVSIIISVLDQLAYTKRCLKSIEDTLSNKISYEVLIVDDCSNDQTIEFLRSLDFPHKVFLNSERKGFAKNNNFAASEAKGEFLCLLNNDCFVEGDWLLPMIEVFKQKENVGVVGNVQRRAGTKMYDHMGVVFDPRGKPVHFGQGYYHRPLKSQVREWYCVTAACCVVRKREFLLLNGFDEIFINGCEDFDLCLRFYVKGYMNFVVHDSVVEHVRCATEGRLNYNLQNEAIFHARWKEKINEINTQKNKLIYSTWFLTRTIYRLKVSSFKLLIECIAILIKYWLRVEKKRSS